MIINQHNIIIRIKFSNKYLHVDANAVHPWGIGTEPAHTPNRQHITAVNKTN